MIGAWWTYLIIAVIFFIVGMMFANHNKKKAEKIDGKVDDLADKILNHIKEKV